jgi:hypothetical protein
VESEQIMSREGSLAVATIVGILVVVIIVMAVPGAAATAGSPGLAPAPAVDVTTPGTAALGAPGPMHGAGAVSVLRNPADAQFGPATPARGHQSFSPGCTVAPCPTGVTDYGVTPAGKSYSYNATTMGAFADISVFKIGAATGGGCIDANAVSCMTFQENTIVNGIEIKNQKGQYWAQDVPEVALDGKCSAPCVSNDYSVTWEDNIWNFSSGSSILNSAHMTGNLNGACSTSGVFKSGTQDYYACVGPTDYGLTLPFTIWAMTGTGPNANKFYGGCSTTKSSCIQFWGAIFEGNTEPFSGWFDQVDFSAGSLGGGDPVFHIANAPSPYGTPYDAEWVMGGPGGGSSVKMTSTDAILQSEYNTGAGSTSSSPGTWNNVQHAWSSGDDTAETATNVVMVGYSGIRYLASAAKGTANPGTSLW